jgi:CDGSH-type Zn-finger protein
MTEPIIITAKENGPYLVKGPVTHTDASGNTVTVEGAMVALCRCGQSANKPFCDGSHRKVDFQATAHTVILPVIG